MALTVVPAVDEFGVIDVKDARAATVKPLKAYEVPTAVLTVIVRGPVDALLDIVTAMGREVSVPPL